MIKKLHTLILIVPFLGFISQPAWAQFSTINWGDHSVLNIVAPNITATGSSTLSGSMLSTDAGIPATLTIQNGVFVYNSLTQVNSVFSYVNNQLTSTTNSNTSILTPSLGETSVSLGSGTDNNNLKPGIYVISGDVKVADGSVLTLNDGGDKNALFIFKIKGNLISNGLLKLINGFPGLNVYWQVEGQTAINGSFAGNIVSTGGIAMTGSITGRLFSSSHILLNSANVDIPTDTDKDGIYDNVDDYPLDATKAFNNDSKLNPQIVAFEDLWPSKGDYDYNDVVMKTTFNYITNAQNYVVQVVGTFTLMATGGVQKNSFHMRFIGSNFRIENLVPKTLTGGEYEHTNSGVSFKIYDDMRKEMAEWNTIPGRPLSPFKTYTLQFEVKPTAKWIMETIVSDPFIVNYVGSSRREIHLPSIDPTSLVDYAVLNTKDDNSADVSYTSTLNGLPWVIMIPTDMFDYPVEKKDISTAFLHFVDYSQTNSLSFPDWFSSPLPGYRDLEFIFVK